MKTSTLLSRPGRLIARSERGSALITALIFALIIAITLVGYIQMATNSLKFAHRTFFADSVCNLAEAGTEEAVWCFNQMGNSGDTTANDALWTANGWTLTDNVADAYMTSTGSGYTSAPTVTFSGGGGSGAAGTATITTAYVTYGGVTTAITSVTGITITNPGSGYTSAPTITLTGGGGSGAVAQARRAATRTITFSNLDQNASATVKVWVAGYDGSAVVPIAVTKATVTPFDGSAPIVKYLKIILSKTGLLPKGLIAKNGITWNGHPLADSYVSSTVPGVPPFTAYNVSTARANTTVGSLYGPTINLGAQGVVNGNVMLGPGVTLTGGTVSGQTIGNLSYSFNMPTYPTNTGAAGYYSLGNVNGAIPATLPRAGDVTPAADGKYYYFVNGVGSGGAVLGATTVTAGKNVVLVGTNTSMIGGLVINPTAAGVPNGSLTVYMDGTMSPGNSSVNPTSWAGALQIYTTTTGTCTISGNGYFAGCLFAPNASLVGNGGGNNTQDMCGSFVVGSVTSNGHLSFHYDEGLGSPSSPKAWSLALWAELQSDVDRALYASKLNF